MSYFTASFDFSYLGDTLDIYTCMCLWAIPYSCSEHETVLALFHNSHLNDKNFHCLTVVCNMWTRKMPPNTLWSPREAANAPEIHLMNHILIPPTTFAAKSIGVAIFETRWTSRREQRSECVPTLTRSLQSSYGWDRDKGTAMHVPNYLKHAALTDVGVSSCLLSSPMWAQIGTRSDTRSRNQY